MARFSQLPVEILLHIVNEVRSNRDLAAFSRSCRTVYNLSREEMPLRRKYRRIQLNSITDLERGFALLLAILRRPQLGHLVRHLELDRPPTSYRSYEIQNKDLKTLEDGDFERLKIAVKNAGFTDEYGEKVLNMVLQSYEFRSAYSGTPQDDLRATWVAQALAALLISVSPYMESMSMSIIMYNFTGYHDSTFCIRLGGMRELRRFPLEKLLMDTNENPHDKPWLQYLQSVELINNKDNTWDDGRFYEAFDLFGMLRFFDKLPSIEGVGIDAMAHDENGLSSLPPKSSNISRIRIEHSNINTIYQMHLINSCKVLKEFHYSIGGRASSDGSFSRFNPRTFLKTILGHKTTLEVLDIDSDEDCHYIDIEGPPYDFEMISHDENEDPSDNELMALEELWGRSGSLSDFSSLTHLSIGVAVFSCLARGTQSMDIEDSDKVTPFDQVVLADALPASLESLCLRGYKKGLRPDFDESITRFLAEKDAKLPNLKNVTGIEECIENASTINAPDDEGDLLWEREEEDWTEYEF